MSPPPPTPACSYVELIQDGVVRVRLLPHHSLPAAVVRAAHSHSPYLILIPYESEATLASILGALRDADVAFVHQEAGWPPSAVFEDLRDKALLGGPFIAISWRAAGQPFTFVR